jgi:Polysaccharide lyase
MQWHQDHADGSPPLALSVHSDDKVYFEMEADGDLQELIPVWTVRPGAWEHVVIHVKWSRKKDEGFVEAFVNGVQMVPRTFRQTMYTSDRRNFLKIGCYRRRSNTETAVVMHDNLRVSGPPAAPHP